MKKTLLLTFIISIIFSCQNGPTQSEFDKIKADLENCTKENADLKNTPENRLLTAQKFEIEGNIEQAEKEYRELSNKFPKSE